MKAMSLCFRSNQNWILLKVFMWTWWPEFITNGMLNTSTVLTHRVCSSRRRVRHKVSSSLAEKKAWQSVNALTLSIYITPFSVRLKEAEDQQVKAFSRGIKPQWNRKHMRNKKLGNQNDLRCECKTFREQNLNAKRFQEVVEGSEKRGVFTSPQSGSQLCFTPAVKPPAVWTETRLLCAAKMCLLLF